MSCSSCCPCPKFIKSCSIRNESSGDVQVYVSYKKLGYDLGDSDGHQYDVTISQGETHRVEPRIVKHDLAFYNSQINKIDVTLVDGNQLHVEEPFDGVREIQNDWLFVINDHGIKSLSAEN
ncbi:unnamed protein product [Rotaria magnacalcarata]|uniref:Uncharacterized protein n=1 Tax=Rotaria magnacalcarata TaxID=392030 RepID=A0A816PHK3_9BILA|nr:unnamed protein product [Rotaria magnacalcarata]CAF2033792.1 unnamed protein product [Rotaria magnacalcarata]CAF2049293.1 unnamed protein product [Rotaria magnacalcarata]CAF2155572.1 unnamed protein product [Rotaria magnacalcarata]CAF4301728.1 unnamed protein product [Rotaria magnacalcarata]